MYSNLDYRLVIGGRGGGGWRGGGGGGDIEKVGSRKFGPKIVVSMIFGHKLCGISYMCYICINYSVIYTLLHQLSHGMSNIYNIHELFWHRVLRAARADAAQAGVEAVTPEVEIGETLLDVQVCQQHHQMVKPRAMDPLGMYNNHCEPEKQ